ncbi:MAG: AAA family ATPase [Clostridiales bacterium]|nr:AAA family ATPase [Clostridiales bacterium]
MKKLRVVLADPDENYLLPFVTKFLDEHEDAIELNVITNIDYYNEFFSHPQELDVLLVGESFYSSTIRRHNISNIYVLTENSNEDSSTVAGEIHLFKYSSIPSIYNRIASSSKMDTSKSKETSVVLFYSATGGSGKTSVALAVSEFIAQNYKRVLYINAEQMNAFYKDFQDKTPIPNNVILRACNDPAEGMATLKRAVKNQSFDYLPPFSLSLSSLNIPFNIYENFIDYIKMTKEYDYIIVDTDSVWNLEKASMVAKANKVLVISNQTNSSVFSTNILLNNMICKENDKFYFICNKYNGNISEASLSEKAQFIISGYIPFVNNLETLGWKELANDINLQNIALLAM